MLDLQGDKRIKSVTLKNPWQAPDLPILKETILNIKAVDHRDITFIVEMQVKDNPCFDKRALFYTAKAYTAQISKGEDYSSWERGTNENTNGLIRQYFPKNRDFTTITQQEIDTAMNRLNNRPRKRLEYKTPSQVFFKPGVALQT